MSSQCFLIEKASRIKRKTPEPCGENCTLIKAWVLEKVSQTKLTGCKVSLWAPVCVYKQNNAAASSVLLFVCETLWSRRPSPTACVWTDLEDVSNVSEMKSVLPAQCSRLLLIFHCGVIWFPTTHRKFAVRVLLRIAPLGLCADFWVSSQISLGVIVRIHISLRYLPAHI